MKIMLLTIFLLGVVNYSNAAQTPYGTIDKIKAFSSQAYIYVPAVGDRCSSGDREGKVRLYWTTTQSDKLWSMLLAAQMAGKEVSFEGSCVSGLLSAEAVYIKN